MAVEIFILAKKFYENVRFGKIFVKFLCFRNKTLRIYFAQNMNLRKFSHKDFRYIFVFRENEIGILFNLIQACTKRIVEVDKKSVNVLRKTILKRFRL